MKLKLPVLGGFAWLHLCSFGILLVGNACSRYPTAEARQGPVAGKPERVADAEIHAKPADTASLSKWSRMVHETIEQSAREHRVVLIINKYRHTLSAYMDGYRVAEYGVDLGSNPSVPKRHHGDSATPEGRYRVVKKLGARETRYRGAFIIDYPNAKDYRVFRSLQRYSRQRMKIGGGIAIQGGGGQDKDWTRGSIALENEAIDELFPYVAVGTPVTIVRNETVQPERKLRGGR